MNGLSLVDTSEDPDFRSVCDPRAITDCIRGRTATPLWWHGRRGAGPERSLPVDDDGFIVRRAAGVHVVGVNSMRAHALGAPSSCRFRLAQRRASTTPHGVCAEPSLGTRPRSAELTTISHRCARGRNCAVSRRCTAPASSRRNGSRRRVLRSGAVARQDTIPRDASARHRHVDQPTLRRDGQLSAHKCNSCNKKIELHEYRRPGQRTAHSDLTTGHPLSSSCDVADHRPGEIIPLQPHVLRFRMHPGIAENRQMRRPEAIGLRPPHRTTR